MAPGLLLAFVAGALISLQNIFNSRVNERAGSWATTTWVLGLGALASLLFGWLLDGKQMFMLEHMKPWYWVSGVMGVGVVTCLMEGIKRLGPTYAVSIITASQLGLALLCDSQGWLGLEKIPLTSHQWIGVLVILGGIIVFKFGGRRNSRA